MSSPSQQPPQAPTVSDVLATAARILTFRATREELLNLRYKHLAVGLVCALIVGIGRYYDNDRVGLLQHLGIGSVIYVLLLSLFLWLLIWPMRPRDWSYLRVAAFVSLVSPPAILYAIPVQYFYSVDVANGWNALFLGIVATWRVALLVFYLRRLAQLDWFATGVATLMPLTFIVVSLTMLNLDRVVYDLMGGFRRETADDSSYSYLIALTYFSLLMFIPLLLSYVYLVVQARVGKKPDYWPEWMDE